MKRGYALFALLACATQSAQAQSLPLEDGIRFSLQRHPGLSPRSRPLSASPAFRARMDTIDTVNADDRDQDILIGVQRTTQRFFEDSRAASLDPHALSRSRMTRYMIEDRLQIGEQAIVTFGWHGIKVSNRSANVTVGPESDRLRTRDWFLPRATLAIQAGRDLRLSVGYAEKLRAYGDTGTNGPMGLTHDAYLSLRRTLKPETQSRTQVRGDWSATSAIDVSLALMSGRLDDQLSFAGRGVLPISSGSARIEGAVLEAQHRLTPRLSWSVRYGDARVHISGGNMVHERSLSVGSKWHSGPWSAAVSFARNSAPALVSGERRALRIAGGIDYAVAGIGGRPLTLSFQMTDPDRLASTSFAHDDLSGPLRASDQVRTVMASARFGW